MILFFIAFSLILTIFGYMWIKKRYSYWSSKGIEGPKPYPIVGNFGTVMTGKEHQDRLLQRIYNDYPNAPFVGIYQAFRPVLLVRDPELIKQILIKDFNVFQNRAVQGLYPHNDNAFTSDGEAWKVLRGILSRSFTPGKLKAKIPLYAQSADEFLKYVDDSLEHGSDYEMQYDLMWRYNLHVTGLFLFGSDIKALSNEKNDIKHKMDDVMNEVLLPGLLCRYIQYIDQIIPGFQKVASMLKIDPRINNMSILFRFLNKIFERRHGQPVGLNDFPDHMIEQKQRVIEKVRVKFERNEFVFLNQFFIMYVGHVEGLSSFMSFTFNELAFNQEIQDRVYREILEVTKNQNGKITYELLNDMVYLEMVLNEVWRKYAVTFVQRQAVSDYEFPGTKLKIEKGTIVIVPLLGLHYDPNYYPDPEVFNPERFSPENIKSIPDGTFLPFGAGPRACLGMKSAKLQLKYGVAAILRKFKFDPCERSTKQAQFHVTAIALIKTKGIWLKVSKRTTPHS